ncbi:exo-beta-1,3-glucanase [Methylomonas sp. SURF-2]|uniref:Endo-1,3-beta-glucanase btgC n=1 Tax=Methylomonas subterranea TaxID=2952225 RepID=A0ABT1TGC5_9GAMM|nr:exo-beta-1,3-glucanase [Methylomonas sp. SURF-2]MCQ8104516.1 exo-beta-1,3-glucanase [Methylomonas sp. SURF-2]
MSSARLLLCTFAVLLVHASVAWFVNQPRDAGVDVPAGKLMSLSFAPFREGFSPLEEIFPPKEHVDEDLSLLADKTLSVRTYSSVGGGMENVPELARKHGLAVIQGGWLGYGYLDNKKEVDALIKSANANPDVVKRVIVGNEVLLRGDMDVDRLIGYIREVKRVVKQPVSYADVWSMYMKHPQLIKEVDFITIHILPYWEDEPVSVERASEHLEKIVKQVEDEARGIAPGKPILIGESGWPSAGRQRGLAVPGVVNEARFIRGMIQVATRHGFDYNIVEAFNQPWKSNLEGVVGANWGLFSADRKPVFPLTGPVAENPDWLTHFAFAVLIWLTIIAACFKKIQFRSLPSLLVLLLFTQLFSICLVTLAHFLWYTSYSSLQRAYTVFMLFANVVLLVFLIQRYLDILNRRPGAGALAFKLKNAYLFFILLALYKTYGLAVAGRYLSFPIEQFALPVLGIVGLVACQWLASGNIKGCDLGFDQLCGWNIGGRHDRLIAYGLSFAAIAMVFGETKAFLDGRDFIQAHPGLSEGLPVALSYALYNQQLLIWLACLLTLALPFWAKARPRVEE